MRPATGLSTVRGPAGRDLQALVAVTLLAQLWVIAWGSRELLDPGADPAGGGRCGLRSVRVRGRPGGQRWWRTATAQVSGVATVAVEKATLTDEAVLRGQVGYRSVVDATLVPGVVADARMVVTGALVRWATR